MGIVRSFKFVQVTFRQDSDLLSHLQLLIIGGGMKKVEGLC